MFAELVVGNDEFVQELGLWCCSAAVVCFGPPVPPRSTNLVARPLLGLCGTILLAISLARTCPRETRFSTGGERTLIFPLFSLLAQFCSHAACRRSTLPAPARPAFRLLEEGAAPLPSRGRGHFGGQIRGESSSARQRLLLISLTDMWTAECCGEDARENLNLNRSPSGFWHICHASKY